MSKNGIPEMTGIMVCGHGSRNQNAAREFATVAEGLKARYPDVPVEYGYLEFCNPVISEGLDRLRAKGVTRVLAVPGMLFAAGHAKNDIPSVLNTYQAQNPGTVINYGRELGIDLKMIRAAGARIQEALDTANRDQGEVALHDTLLMVVGRGSSDPDANSNVSKVMRMLWEGFGFGWGETCYSGVTFPLVGPGLSHAAKLGYKRIIVFPYFLFTGVLVKRIYSRDRRGGGQPSRDPVHQGVLSQRSPAGHRHIPGPGAGDPRRPGPDELPDVQVPRAGAGFRGRGRAAAGKPSPPCRGHRRRTGELPLQGRLRCVLPGRGFLQAARAAVDAGTQPREPGAARAGA
jgi:sirohydrochlorin ferrochelatase